MKDFYKLVCAAVLIICVCFSIALSSPVGALAAEVLADITHPEATVGAGAVLDAAPADAVAVSGFASGVQALIGLAATAFLAFVGYIVSKLADVLKRKFNIEIDDRTRNYLEDALYNAITYAEKKAMEKAAGIKSPFSADQKIGIAADYLFEHVPDALRHFGLTREKVIRMIEARLGHGGSPDKDAPTETQSDADPEEEELANGSA